MTLCMYDASVPVLIHTLTNLGTLLTKAEAYAEEKKIDPLVLTSARLAPDMFALAKQIQIACDMTKGGVARLAGVEIPSFADTETTFAQLQERIAKTIAFAKTITPAQVNGTESKTIALKVGGHEMTFAGQPYLLGFVLPNVYFHATTAYAILRHNGVPLGKMDFLGAIQ